MPHEYQSLEFTETFLLMFASRDFPPSDRRAFLKALRLLDENENEKHPSLRVHKLEGDRIGSWSASASVALRTTYERTDDGTKRLLTCSKHYADKSCGASPDWHQCKIVTHIRPYDLLCLICGLLWQPPPQLFECPLN